MRVIFTSDLHGSARLLGLLGDLLGAERPGLLILGGDNLSDGPEDDPVGGQLRELTETLVPRIAQWRAALPGLHVAWIAGNHEWLPTLEAMGKSDVATLLTLDQPRAFGGVTFLGCSYSPPTPFMLKDLERLDQRGDPIPPFDGARWDADRKTVAQITAADHFSTRPTFAEELARAAPTPSPFVFVCHAPPHATRLDHLPAVDHPVGSTAVRAFLLERRPILSLHGHVHESPIASGAWRDEVGSTICVNPGQGEDTLHAVFFDLDNPRDTLRHTVLD
ncbi:MAG: metallophosphoesterase [Phycisphaerales bacterium]|nr:metallophosphoesterase [Phycisphaerales bacterium]